MGERLTDDAYQQVRIAADDLIEAMAKFRETLDAEMNRALRQATSDRIITRRDAYYQAMQASTMKEAISDCHWASERATAFGMIYQCAVLRTDELAERQAHLS